MQVRTFFIKLLPKKNANNLEIHQVGIFFLTSTTDVQMFIGVRHDLGVCQVVEPDLDVAFFEMHELSDGLLEAL